jgi:hypothetical protein
LILLTTPSMTSVVAFMISLKLPIKNSSAPIGPSKNRNGPATSATVWAKDMNALIENSTSSTRPFHVATMTEKTASSSPK